MDMTLLASLLVGQSAVWVAAQEYNVYPRFEITEARITRDKENTIRAIVDERGFKASVQNLLDRQRISPDSSRFDARNATLQRGAFERKYEVAQLLTNDGVKLSGKITRSLGPTRTREIPVDVVLPAGKAYAIVFMDLDGKRKLILLSLTG